MDGKEFLHQMKMRAHCSNPNSFQRAMKPVLVTAQCFALMPVCGITNHNAASLRFKWLSLRVFYSVVIIIGLIAMSIFTTIDLFDGEISFRRTRGAVFCSSATLSCVMFLHLATKWKSLMLEWESVELRQQRYGYPKNLLWKINGTALFIISMATAETILANFNSVMWGATCQRTGQGNLLYCYAMSSYRHIFRFISYSSVVAIIAICINFVATFSWSFIDLFIILISTALTERFRLFNNHLKSINGKVIKEESWERLREEYNSLSCLTRSVNTCISNILLVSFGSNLYFICTQLLNSLIPMESTIEKVYFYLSFGYLLLRAGMVSLYAANVNEESHVPRAILFSVPSESYCTEVLRFERQVTTDEVALSASNFFSITRSMILTLVGTIVTYEVVLVQFNNVSGGSCITVANVTASS
ncbi:gustatory receptor for sugar taste 64f-like [Periplaneta americana]|uniref:gustatory receptor for sugar taste 64f-like n=1 Tax=Periplaneta americana TaxID=6978 RepID=UPI0037E9C968